MFNYITGVYTLSITIYFTTAHLWSKYYYYERCRQLWIITICCRGKSLVASPPDSSSWIFLHCGIVLYLIRFCSSHTITTRVPFPPAGHALVAALVPRERGAGMDEPAAPLPTSPSCQLPSWLAHLAPGTMASSEEDGTVEEKENNNKRRTKSALATAWLTFYNIAMTAGYVRNNPPPPINKKSLEVSRSLKQCVAVNRTESLWPKVSVQLA